MNRSVEPGQRLGDYFIGEDLASLLEKVPVEVEVDDLELFWRYGFKPFTVWVNKQTRKVSQIGAEEGFEGTFRGLGIGSTLMDVLKRVGPYKEELDVYVLPQYPGIAFELQEEDFGEDWEELTTPFGFISVFDPKEVIG